MSACLCVCEAKGDAKLLCKQLTSSFLPSFLPSFALVHFAMSSSNGVDTADQLRGMRKPSGFLGSRDSTSTVVCVMVLVMVVRVVGVLVAK